MQNWNVNLDKNDKVYKYWQKSKDQSQKPYQCKNTIKLSSSVDHNSMYLIEETTNSNGNIFIKQHRFNKSEMLKYLVEKKNQYSILVDGKDIFQKTPVNINPHKPVYKNKEYKNIGGSIHRLGYQSSFNEKYR